MAMRAAPTALTLMATSTSGCLVTGEPDYSDPEPNTPLIVAVDPAATELVRLESPTNDFENRQFSVSVRSEDADDPLTAVLLLDYGIATNVGEAVPQPYANVIQTREIQTGSLSDQLPRLVSLTWLPKLADQAVPECHSVTMLVVRDYIKEPPFNFCPTNDQFAAITWHVALCDVLENCDLNTCPKLGDDTTYCPNPNTLEPTGAP